MWTEQGGRTSGSVRGGVVLPATEGVSTPVGGILDSSTDIYTEVADGLTFGWLRTRSVGNTETDKLLTAAAATLRANGLAQW
ncbi:MAG: hypothetical protein DCC49_05115 [Acidobacteria bacterium]|nr:MAG: hypothetical protein DCC49_05115 [Acidobacteriota bacterium]